MKELQDKLHLPKLPYQIECFDNSNISGTDAVAACVVFKKMKPSKKDYKHYNIKTVVGPDDYASMKEVVHRRYSRLIEEHETLPDLIVADGGKGQMEVIREVIQDELHLDIPIAGLAKNDRHRTNELLYGFPPLSVQLKTDSELSSTCWNRYRTRCTALPSPSTATSALSTPSTPSSTTYAALVLRPKSCCLTN